MNSRSLLFGGKPSTRIRVLKHLARQKAQSLDAATGSQDDPNKPGELGPGMMQLYSYNAPSLQGGLYTITVEHTVQTADGSQSMNNPPVKSIQHFNVNAPRFTLPSGIVHSTYPPQGLGDHNNVLPHIVFEDPHFPWEQEGSPRQDKIDTAHFVATGELPKNKVPWVALLTFTEDELKLSDDELKKKSENGLFPEITQIPPKNIPAPSSTPGPSLREQSQSTFSLQLTMDEYLEMGGDSGKFTATVTTPVLDNNPDEKKIDRTTQVDVIFPPASHIDDLFASYDDDGQREPIPQGTQVLPDLSKFKYLAHVRNVNTKNIANAGTNDDGLFSVVHAHRSGPLDLKTAKPVIVHLVTLEGFERPADQTPNIMLPLNASKRVALVSLYSWTYLCLPPEEVNFIDSMRHIGFAIEAGQCWLRAPDDFIAKLSDAAAGTSTSPSSDPPTPQQKVASRLSKRLTDGYCLQRYMLQTGEETVAFNRGPLTTRWVPAIRDSWWPLQSNFSSDYQILDPSLSIMDITYSSAWQLGRTLGIANQAFTAALVRLRSVIQTTSRRQALKDQTPRSIKSKAQTAASLRATVETLSRLASGDAGSTPAAMLNRHLHVMPKAVRFMKAGSGQSLPTIAAPAEVHDAFFRSHVLKTAVHLGSARVLDASPLRDPTPPAPNPNDEVYIPFNDINVPNSSDWQIVQSWILDNMFLKNIPPHYFLPDPSYLPPESMRFFYIDNNWMDAFVDGALSIGNHLDRTDDVVRQAFKYNLNQYFDHFYHENNREMKYYPQIPCFGFLLRSAVVKAFPDLQIQAPWAASDAGDGVREPTLRFEAIAPDTLLCLFDRMPGSSHWDADEQITLTQPPHQQTFRLGVDAGLTATQLEVEFPSIYTTTLPDTSDAYEGLRIVKWSKGGAAPDEGDAQPVALPKAVFNWDSRMLVPSAFANASYNVLEHDMSRPDPPNPNPKKWFDEGGPTAAVVGTVLTSTISKMKIELPQTTITDPTQLPPDYTKNPRQIRVGDLGPTNPDDYQVVPPDNDPVTPTPPPPAPGPAPATAPPAATPGRPAGMPAGFNPDEIPPIPKDQRTYITDPSKKVLQNPIGQQFKLLVFPLGTPAPKTAVPPLQIHLPKPNSDADIPIDLVVGLSLIPSHDTVHNLQLFSITIDIPIGHNPKDLLAPDTKPTGARMLSNVRFNVHVAPTSGGTSAQEKLSFTLIPRNTGKLVPLVRTPEASFVINQVRWNGVAGLASVVVQENYRRQDGDDASKGHAMNWARSGVVLQKIGP